MGVKRKQRNSSIEMLRIIAMIGVVILHYNNATMGGGFAFVKEGSINQYYLFLTESLFICAVNLYVMVSAYFLCTSQQRKLIKIVELVIQVSLFRCLFYVLEVLQGGAFSTKSFLGTLLPVNYFVVLYSALYIISPYINVLIKNLSKKRFEKLIISLIVLFSGWTIFVDFVEGVTGVALGGLSTVSAQGSQKGYTIVNFVLAYFIGSYIRLYGIKWTKKKVALGAVCTWMLIFVFSVFEKMIGNKSMTTWCYNNPLVFAIAALVLLLAVNVNFVSRLINELAKGAFTCFLFHTALLEYVGIRQAVNSNIMVLILHQLGVAVLLYGISYLVYKIYYLCSHWGIRLIEPLCNRVELSVKD